MQFFPELCVLFGHIFHALELGFLERHVILQDHIADRQRLITHQVTQPNGQVQFACIGVHDLFEITVDHPHAIGRYRCQCQQQDQKHTEPGQQAGTDLELEHTGSPVYLEGGDGD